MDLLPLSRRASRGESGLCSDMISSSTIRKLEALGLPDRRLHQLPLTLHLSSSGSHLGVSSREAEEDHSADRLSLLVKSQKNDLIHSLESSILDDESPAQQKYHLLGDGGRHWDRSQTIVKMCTKT